RGEVLGPPRAQRLEARPAVVGRERDPEEVAELAVEVAGATLGMLDGADHHVGKRTEPRGEQAQGDALSCTGVAGKHGEATVGQADLDAPEEGVDERRDVEGLRGQVGAEGDVLQAVEGQEPTRHGVNPPRGSWAGTPAAGPWPRTRPSTAAAAAR